MNAILALFGTVGPQELIFLLLILIIFFGAKKLPELAKGLGQGIKEFKKATREINQDDDLPKVEEKKSEEESK